MVNNIQLYKGDCLEIMGVIEDKSVDMILCDLPYGNNKTACKWDSVIPLDKLWEQYNRIIKDNGAIVLFGSQPFTSQLIISNPNMFRYELIWDKKIGGAFVLANKRPLPKHENILIFYKKSPTYNPQMADAKPENIRPINKGTSQSEALPVAGGIAKSSKSYNKNKRFPTSILECSSKIAECNSINRVHPTQKPVVLLEYLIKTYTAENEIVLDNCMGSGSTGVACINTNRKFIGIELDEKYFEIAKRRIEECGFS